MKNGSFALIFSLLSAFLSFGQQRVVISPPVNELVNVQLPIGKFIFEIPNDITSLQAEESANYYTMYFSIEYDQSSGKVTATMEQNEAKSRHILIRFFASLGLVDIEVNGTIMSLEKFYQTYLN
jgi:hypothetical protein